MTKLEDGDYPDTNGTAYEVNGQGATKALYVAGRRVTDYYHKIEIVEAGKARCKLGGREKMETWEPDLREIAAAESSPPPSTKSANAMASFTPIKIE